MRIDEDRIEFLGVLNLNFTEETGVRFRVNRVGSTCGSPVTFPTYLIYQQSK
jgi:hypothetical protein